MPKIRDWDSLYKTYEDAYNIEAERKIREKVPIKDKLTPEKFEAVYLGTEADEKAEIKRGERKSLNIIKDIISNQKIYPFSYRAARVIKEAIKQSTGEIVKTSTIRMGKSEAEEELWKDIKKRRKELKSQGHSAEDVKNIIGQEFFGSE